MEGSGVSEPGMGELPVCSSRPGTDGVGADGRDAPGPAAGDGPFRAVPAYWILGLQRLQLCSKTGSYEA